MNIILQLRKQLGISQHKFAHLLGVKRTTLAMAELGKRFLPDRAWERFYEIQSQANNQDFVPGDDAQSSLQSMIDKEVMELEHEKHRYFTERMELQLLLRNMQVSHEKSKASLTTICADMEAFANLTRQMIILRPMYDKEMETFVSTHPKLQQKLAARIEMFTTMIASIDQQISDLKS